LCNISGLPSRFWTCTELKGHTLPSIFLPVVFLKALFSVLYFLACIPPHSALSNPHFLLTITFMQMILNFFSFHPLNFDSSIAHLQTALQQISSWMSANLLRPTLNSSKTEFLIIGLKQQLSKIDNSSLNTTHSARNLGFIFDENLTFSDQISSVCKSCYSHIRELCCIRPYLVSKTASTIAASSVHSKLDYCNFLYYNFAKSQINRLQQIQNCLARTVVKAPKSSHITPTLRSLHWLKINEHIEYKLLSQSLTYKVLTTSQPDYLHNLISVQSTGRTRSSSLVTLARPIKIGLDWIGSVSSSSTNHKPLYHICITLPVQSAPSFIPSTSLCSFSSWLTSSYAYHLITVTTFALVTYHSLDLSLQT